MSTSKTFIKRDLKRLREVKPLGKASLHKLFHSLFAFAVIRCKYESQVSVAEITTHDPSPHASTVTFHGLKNSLEVKTLSCAL